MLAMPDMEQARTFSGDTGPAQPPRKEVVPMTPAESRYGKANGGNYAP